MAQGQSYNSVVRDTTLPYPGILQPGIHSTRATVANSVSTVVTLANLCSNVSIYPEADDIHLDLNGGTATTSNAKIKGGATFQYQGPPIKTFSYISAGVPTGQLNVIGW